MVIHMTAPKNKSQTGSNSRRQNNPKQDEDAWRQGLRRRYNDKVEVAAFYCLLGIIMVIYGVMLYGALVKG